MRKIFFIVILLCAPILHAADIFMPLSEIKPGMRGKGLTVFENNQLESFDLEVLDVVHNFFPDRSIILVKLIGEHVNHTGVAAGMSGSPIYIDNKLIGALAFRFGTFMKDPIAGIMPIEDMLNIFEKEKVRDLEYVTNANENAFDLKDYLFSKPAQKFDLLNLLGRKLKKHIQKIQPIETPLIMTGLHPNIYEKINEKFSQWSFQVQPGGKLNQPPTIKKAELEPGSPVGVVIISGDYDISAVGTVTYREGNKILAFGHPMFNSGPVNVPMARSNVITTLSSLYASNKFAVTSDIIGNIRQDRSSGIMGVLGEASPMIPVRVTVNSPTAKKKVYHYKIANDRSSYGNLPVFLWLTLVNTLESARLANGDYALRLRGKIELEDTAEDIVFDNFYAGGEAGFFSGAGLDISEAAYDVAMTLRALLINKFQPAKIKQVVLDFKATPGQKSAHIEKIFLDKTTVSPGDTVKALIYLKPYQSKIVRLTKQLIIPQNISAKYLTLAVGGNTEITTWEKLAGAARFYPLSFDELIKILNRRRKNNSIIFQLKTKDRGVVLHGREFPTLPPSIYQILNHEKVEKTNKSVKEKILKEWLMLTDFSIRGGRKFKLKLEKESKL